MRRFLRLDTATVSGPARSTPKAAQGTYAPLGQGTPSESLGSAPLRSPRELGAIVAPEERDSPVSYPSQGSRVQTQSETVNYMSSLQEHGLNTKVDSGVLEVVVDGAGDTGVNGLYKRLTSTEAGRAVWAQQGDPSYKIRWVAGIQAWTISHDVDDQEHLYFVKVGVDGDRELPLDATWQGVMDPAPSVRRKPPSHSKTENFSPDLGALNRISVCQWLEKCNEKDARWVLQNIFDTRPNAFPAKVGRQSPLSKEDPANPTLQHASTFAGVVEERDSPVRHKSLNNAPAAPSSANVGVSRTAIFKSERPGAEKVPPGLQFAALSYYLQEDDKEVNLRVLRIGDTTGSSVVHFTTEDLPSNTLSAMAGDTYIHKEGTLEFEPDEWEKEITVTLLDMDSWCRTRTFVVALKSDGRDNCTPDFRGSKAFVHVIDKDCFPSTKWEEEIRTGAYEALPLHGIPLLIEYIKMNWSNSVIRHGTIMRSLAMQVSNFKILVQLFLFNYMIDYVLKPGSFEARHGSNHHHHGHLTLFLAKLNLSEFTMLIFIAVIPLVLLFFEHVSQYAKLTVSVGGPSRRTLQVAILERALHYNSTSHAETSHGKLIMAVSRDAVTLVGQGYNNIIRLSEQAGRITILIIYFCMAPLAFGKPFSPRVIIFSGMYPVFITFFLIVRGGITTRNLTKRNDALANIVDSVEHVLLRIDLYVGYKLRPWALEGFEKSVKAYNGSRRGCNLVVVNNRYLSHWVSNVIVCAITIAFGKEVIEGRMTVGMFLTYVKVLKQLGHAWETVYDIQSEMRRTLPSLQRITELLNKETDLPKLREKTIGQVRRQLGVYALSPRDLAKQGAASTTTRNTAVSTAVLDDVPIKLRNFEVKHLALSNAVDRKPGLSRAKTMFKFNHPNDMDIAQGSLVAIVGESGAGKTTVMKLISGVLMSADSGDDTVTMPAHLHVIHVDCEPRFFNGSLHENLTFGVPEDNKALKKPQRIASICKMLGLGKTVFAYLDNHELVLEWDRVLAISQRSLLSIARALIADPDVLCIQKPTMYLHEGRSHSVIGVLKKFVRDRGVCLPTDDFSRRRARTCLMTCSKLTGIEEADDVILVDPTRGLIQLEPGQVTSSML